MSNSSIRAKSAKTPRQGAQGAGCSRHAAAAAYLASDPRRGEASLAPTPEILGQLIAEVPSGRVITLAQLAEQLKQRCGGEPVAERTLLEALRRLERMTVEVLEQEREPEVSLWRLLRDDGTVDPASALPPRYSAARLRAEGHRVTWDDGCWKVLDSVDVH